MARVVVLQRIVPSYRLPVFRQLANELGWKIVFGRNVPSDNLAVCSGEPFLHPVDFKPWSRHGSSRYVVPIRHILDKFAPDAIIAEGALGLTSTWALGARRTFGGPLLLFWTIGYEPNHPRERGNMALRQWPYVAAYAPADALILYGRDGVDFLRRFYANKPMFVAQNTIDVEALQRHRDQATPAAKTGRPELITIGRLNANKNFPSLVRSFLAFRRQFPDAVLKIIGDGPDRTNIEAAAGEQLGTSIRLLGASFEEAQTARHMLSADMFVMAGRIGLAINHALAYDLPVMAFERVPSGPQHGSEIGYLVDGVTGFAVREADEDGFSRKLIEVFSNGLDWKERLRPALRDYVQRNLIIDRMVDGFRAADAFIAEQLKARAPIAHARSY
jgi:glycosyltransferase involved in cell wall biosynthesis